MAPCRDLVALGGQRSGFNFNLEDKRVVNMVSEVKDEDNIKQDMSIDVYGRKEADEKAAVRGNCAAAEQEVLIAVCAWMAVRRLEKAAGRNDALLQNVCAAL